MDVIFQVTQIFICVLDAYLIIDFYFAFFILKKLIERKYTKVGLIFGASACVYAINSLNNATANFVGTSIIYLFIIVLVFQGKLLKKFLYYITAMTIMFGSEFVCVVLLSLPTDFALNKVESNQIKVIAAMFSVKLLALVLFSMAKRIAESSDNRRISFKITLLYSIMPISLIGIMIAITQLNINFTSLESSQILLTISCILTLVGSVVIFYVFDRYSQFIWQLQQQELMLTKLEMEEKHYAQIEQVNQEHAIFLHDVRHFMKAIGEMAADDNCEAIRQILSELQIKISDKESELLCANRLLNTILNEKKKDAERKGIRTKIVVENGFSVEQIIDTDMIAIMGNLLDNAIEAAERCQQGYIKVYLFTQNENQFSVIKIVNSYVDEIVSEENRLLTNKPDKSRHGFGVQNVSDIAVKYGGYLQYFYKDGEFTSVVILQNLHEK